MMGSWFKTNESMYIVYLVPYQSKNFCRLSTTNEPQSCTIYTELPEIG